MKVADAIESHPGTSTSILRNIGIAGWTMHCVLALIWISSLFTSSDHIGQWAQILGWGYALGVLVAVLVLSVTWCFTRSLPLSLAPAIIAACCVMALCTFGACALALERPMLSAYDRIKGNLGCAEINLPGEASHILCDQHGQRYSIRSEPVNAVPPTVELAVRMAEDLHENQGVIFVQPIDQVRAILHPGSQGASNICEQVSRRLLAIPHQRHGIGRFLGKFKVILGCLVLSGSVPQRGLLAAYVGSVNCGTVGDADLDGFPAAASVLFGRKMADLDPAAAIVLASIVQQPARFFPVRRPGESEDQVEERRERLKVRLGRVIANGIRHHLLSQQKADEILTSWEGELVSPEKMVAALPPSIRLVREAIREHVPDLDSRYLRVKSSFDPAIQAVAKKGLASGLIHVRTQLPAALRGKATADVSVLNAGGNRVASINLTSTASDVGSIAKPVLYALAIEAGQLANMHTYIEGERADIALARSHRGPAKELVRRISAHRYANFVALAGFSVTNAALVERGDGNLSAADGSGISASPDQIGGALRMFGYRRPGVLVAPDFTPQITDRISGQILYHAPSRTLLNAGTASEVGNALELTAKIGTTKQELQDLVHLGVRSKTGTPHTMRNGVPVGGGGVFCGAFDRNYVVVVRLRLTDGDVPLDGAAGCRIVHDILQGIYDLKAH